MISHYTEYCVFLSVFVSKQKEQSLIVMLLFLVFCTTISLKIQMLKTFLYGKFYCLALNDVLLIWED